MNPYFLLALLVALIAASGSSFIYGQHIANVACKAANVDAVNKAVAQKDKELKQANDQSAKLEKNNALTNEANRILNERLNTVAERPMYRADCLDDDGVSIANTALTGTSSTSSRPDAGVPKPSPAP